MQRITVLIALLIFLTGCGSTGLFKKKEQLTNITGQWLQNECHRNDFSRAQTIPFSNCSQVGRVNGKPAYECDFTRSRQRGLFALTENNKARLLCGVNSQGYDPQGIVYTNSSSDMSGVGKVVVGALVVGAAAALAASNQGRSGGAVCPSSYGEKPLWDLQRNGWHCRDANSGEYTHACKCAGQIKIDNWR